MEEKKVLNDEKIKDVTGGRRLAEKEFAGLDPEKKEKLLKALENHDPLPSKPLTKELLDRVSGGGTQTYMEQCPRCGEWEVLETYPGGWEIYCPKCNIVYDASFYD